MTDKERVKELVKRGCSERMDSEQALRDAVIGGGLLEAMGYSFDKGEWQVNVPIQVGSVTYHMDYLISGVGSSFVLEAKNPMRNLNRDNDVAELLSYMKLSESNYGVLYNGKELLAFEKGSNLPFYEWSYKNDVEIFEMFSNGNFPKRLEYFIKSRRDLAKFQAYVKENTGKIKEKIIDSVASDSNTSKETVGQYFPFLISLFSSERERQTLETQENLESYDIRNVPETADVSRHLTGEEAELTVLKILKNKPRETTRKQVVEEAGQSLSLSKWDLERTKSGRLRWQAFIRWAVTSLHKKNQIESRGRNNWVITVRGKERLRREEKNHETPLTYPEMRKPLKTKVLKPVGLTIYGERFNVDKSNQILIRTAEWLISKGKLTKQNMPIESGPDRWLINREPIHKNKKEFFMKHQLSNGLFMEMNYGSLRIEQLAKYLMRRCGYNEGSLVVEWQK